MGYLFRFLCVCALGLMPLIGCSETAGDGGSGGSAGTGGTGGADGNAFSCTKQGILDAIQEGGGPHTFDCDGPTTVVTEREIVIDNDVILDGEDQLTVSGVGGEERYRVFRVPLSHSVIAELRGFTVTTGGIIINGPGALTLTNCTVSDSISDSPLGGGIDNSGDLTMRNCTVSGNDAGKGGGIFNDGRATVTNSTVSGNSAFGGGGIYNVGALTLTNSTVSGNEAFGGGGIFNEGELTLTHSTVSRNTSDDFGDAIWNDGGAVALTNSLVDGQCGGDEITSNGYNIESPGDTCGLDAEGDRVSLPGWRLNLGPLSDNGGPTETHALGDGSFAIDRIPKTECEANTDQRGEPRPAGMEPRCDVGAFELQVPFSCTEQGIRDAISTGGGPHTFSCDAPTTVVTQREIVIDNDVILDGEGNLRVDGDDDHRVFSVQEGVTAELNGFTVSGGFCDSEGTCVGSAIMNSGTSIVSNSTLSNNLGVALLNEGTLTVRSSTMSNPEGAPDGVHSPGTLTIVNSTIDDMIQNFGMLTVMQSTVDRVDSQFEDSVTIANSLVAQCVDAEQPSSAGYNIESPGNTCGFDQPTDRINISAEALRLGPLQDNGGPTETRAPSAGSVAIDAIPPDDCEVDEDQRGESRPAGNGCDVGSVEVQP